jgi:hypothetical protein
LYGFVLKFPKEEGELARSSPYYGSEDDAIREADAVVSGIRNSIQVH